MALGGKITPRVARHFKAPVETFEYSWIPIVPSREKVTGERGNPSTRIAIRLAPSVALKSRLRLLNIHGFP